MDPAALREFESLVRRAIDPIARPSVAYGIARNGETLLLGAIGLADRARGIAATPATPYAVASVTKPMTATAVAMLAEAGSLDLDASIERHLGGLRLEGRAGDPREATLRRVAHHTAGLPLHYRFYYEDEGLAPRPFAEVVARYGKIFSAPGERHVYSNLGYGLLDAAIAEVSGTPYARFMRERIFGPLGMTHTRIGASLESARPTHRTERPTRATRPIIRVDRPPSRASRTFSRSGASTLAREPRSFRRRRARRCRSRPWATASVGASRNV